MVFWETFLDMLGITIMNNSFVATNSSLIFSLNNKQYPVCVWERYQGFNKWVDLASKVRINLWDNKMARDLEVPSCAFSVCLSNQQVLPCSELHSSSQWLVPTGGGVSPTALGCWQCPGQSSALHHLSGMCTFPVPTEKLIPAEGR